MQQLSPELRIDALTGRQVVVASSRSARPGNQIKFSLVPAGHSDDDPFLEGHESETPGEILALRKDESLPNRKGWLLRVVPNRYPAVVAGSSGASGRSHDHNNSASTQRHCAAGYHEVVIECPDLRTRLIELSPTEITRILYAWQCRVRSLRDIPKIEYVSVFRNEGYNAGASLPHCHSQILASEFLPNQVHQRHQRIIQHYDQGNGCLIDDLWGQELHNNVRVIHEGELLAAFCPFASRVAWQVRWCPLGEMPRNYCDLRQDQLGLLAARLLETSIALNTVVPGVPFNINLILPPCSESERSYWFIELLPRTARAAGFEMMTDVDIVTVAPEDAASQLRDAINTSPYSQRENDFIPEGYRWT